MELYSEKPDEQESMIALIDQIKSLDPQITTSFTLLRDLLKENVLGEVEFSCMVYGQVFQIAEKEDSISVRGKLETFVKNIKQSQESKLSRERTEHAPSDEIQRSQEVIDQLFTQEAEVEDEFQKRFGKYPPYVKSFLDLFDVFWALYDRSETRAYLFPKHFDENVRDATMRKLQFNMLHLVELIEPLLIQDPSDRMTMIRSIVRTGSLEEAVKKLQDLLETMAGEVFVKTRESFYQHFFAKKIPLQGSLIFEEGKVITDFRAVVSLQKPHLVYDLQQKLMQVTKKSSLWIRLLGLVQIMDWLMTQ